MGTTIRFFISSTFSDFQTERNVLQEHVFPQLRQLCAASGFRLQPIDLRWGVSEAAGTDRQTLRICFDELARCRAISPDFFLLILLGSRYGSIFLPPELPANLVARLVPRLTQDENRAFTNTYRLDENAVPPAYVLVRPEGPELAEDEQLRLALLRAGRAAADVSEEELFPLASSATHREIQLGLLGTPQDTRDASRKTGVLCAVRHFAGAPRGILAEHFVERDTERAAQAQRLAAAVLGRLPPEQTLRYAVEWPGDQGPTFDAAALAEVYLRLLRPKLQAVIARRVAARQALAAEGHDAVTLANALFERDRAAHVEGRDVELSRLMNYLHGQTNTDVPLIVTGVAGSGKSTLLAEAATRIVATQPNATLVTRYIGVTPGVDSLSALLNNVRQTIAQAYRQPEPPALQNESELVLATAAQLATLRIPRERPLLLVVDALDQLGADTQRTDWLPLHLAPHVRVVVSVLSDRPELGYLHARLPDDQILTLTPLSREAGRAMLHDLLTSEPVRTLSHQQEEAVLAAFTVQGVPLYLRLLAGVARRWRSFDRPQIGTVPLPEHVPEMLQTILEQLEAPEHNGLALVAKTLCDLAAARFGLAEDELLNLLARDAEVREEHHMLSPNSPLIDPRLPLPVALWARLHAELDPLLTERESATGVRLFTFYHQQLCEAVEARYLVWDYRRTECHQALADYFAAQPWLLGPKQWNWRKVDELVPQLELAGDRAAAEQVLTGLAHELEQAPKTKADDPQGIFDLLNALGDRLDEGGYWRVQQRLLLLALAGTHTRKHKSHQAALLTSLGLVAQHLGNTEEAERYYTQALAIRRKLGNRAGEAVVLGNLGLLADDRGQVKEAAQYYEQALALLRAVGDRRNEGTLLDNLGVLAREQGRLDDAAQYYTQALAIRRELGDRAGEGATLTNLGMLELERKHMEQAAQYYKQALTIVRALSNRANEGSVLNNLGGLAFVQGRLDEAARYFEQALAIYREVGSRASEGLSLHNLGLVAHSQGRMEAAVQYYEQALVIRREVGDQRGEGRSLTTLGTVAQEQGRLDEAARYFEQALPISRAIGDPDFAKHVQQKLIDVRTQRP